MQPLIIEEIALTFVDDAFALVAGFGKLALKIVKAPIGRMVQAAMAPIERIANACDVAGVYARRKQAERRECALDRLNPFKGLKHLT